MKTFTEHKKMGNLYAHDDIEYDRELNPIANAAISQMIGGLQKRYDDYPEVTPHEEYMYICLFESLRSLMYFRRLRSLAIFELDHRRIYRGEICEIVEMYSFVFEPKGPENWIKEFLDGDWSALLGYLTYCEIDDQQLEEFDLPRILEPSKSPKPRDDGAWQVALVLALLSSGVDPDEYLPNALGFFATRGNCAIVQLLLDYGANPNGTPGNRAPLACAASAGQTAVIDILLRTAKLKPIHGFLIICFMDAVNSKHMTAAKRLLTDPRMSTPDLLDMGGSHVDVLDVLRLLLEEPRFGPELLADPISAVVWTKDLGVIGELMRSEKFRKGVNVPWKNGKTVINVAREAYGFEDIVELLQTAGSAASP